MEYIEALVNHSDSQPAARRPCNDTTPIRARMYKQYIVRIFAFKLDREFICIQFSLIISYMLLPFFIHMYK